MYLILVQYCRTDTTREWLDTTRTTRTGRETMVYESYTCIYILSLSNDIHFTNCTTRKPLFQDQYDSYQSNGP